MQYYNIFRDWANFLPKNFFSLFLVFLFKCLFYTPFCFKLLFLSPLSFAHTIIHFAWNKSCTWILYTISKKSLHFYSRIHSILHVFLPFTLPNIFPVVCSSLTRIHHFFSFFLVFIYKLNFYLIYSFVLVF